MGVWDYMEILKSSYEIISHVGIFYFGVPFLPVDPSGCSWLHGARVSAPSQVYGEEFRGILGQQDSQAEGRLGAGTEQLFPACGSPVQPQA